MSTPARTILLQLSNEGVHLNSRELLPWTQTNFPPKPNFHFSEHTTHYWRVRQDGYDRTTGTLSVTVVHYGAAHPEPHFSQQMPKAPVQHIRFARLDWVALQGNLSVYRKDAFSGLIQAGIPTRKEDELPVKSTVSRVRIEGRIPLNRLTFKRGYAESEKRLPGISDPVQIILANPHILPEFEAIKPFFGRLLGKRTIAFTGVVEMVGKMIQTVSCISADLNLINDDSISSVRRLVIRDSIKSMQWGRVDKGLFGSGEVFEDTPAEALGNTYRNQEKLLLEEIMDAQNVRNRPQLQFLSGQIHEPSSPLKFTLQPDFGFLFHHGGKTMHHFLWELLNTNATYIWSLPKGPFPLAQAYTLLEREINSIRDHGRMTYIQHTDRTAFVFNRIAHEHRNSDFIDGFPKWRAKIMEMMV